MKGLRFGRFTPALKQEINHRNSADQPETKPVNIVTIGGQPRLDGILAQNGGLPRSSARATQALPKGCHTERGTDLGDTGHIPDVDPQFQR